MIDPTKVAAGFGQKVKGQGRLTFAGGGMGDMAGGHLIGVIHSVNEIGYR